MPDLKVRSLFISHAWAYDAGYTTLVRWFNEAPNFHWRNYSVPSTDALLDKTTSGLKQGLTRQISPAQGVLIVSGMYAAHSGWIEFEVREAQRLGKTIIGIRPWGAERVPTIVQDAAKVMVNWNSASIVDAVRIHI